MNCLNSLTAKRQSHNKSAIWLYWRKIKLSQLHQKSVKLSNLRLGADSLMIRKAYAWALLRWRGHPVSAF